MGSFLIKFLQSGDSGPTGGVCRSFGDSGTHQLTGGENVDGLDFNFLCNRFRDVQSLTFGVLIRLAEVFEKKAFPNLLVAEIFAFWWIFRNILE